MQTPARSFRNEIVTALIALVMLGTAVGLAAVLTGSPEGDSASASPTALSMAPTESPADTAAPPTATPIESTATMPPTVTMPPTATTPPTITASPTVVVPPTETVPPTSTPAPTDEPTVRPRNTAAPSVTPAPTDTAIPTQPPAATQRPASVQQPTPTQRPTLTPRPTRTPVPSLTASATPLPRATATPPPTRTPAPPTALPTATIVLVTPITPTAYTCAPPPDWRTYVIRPGDNLFRISLRAGLPLQEIQRVNCIPNAASIEAGTVLYVPPAFFYSSAPTSGVGTDTTSSIPRMEGCGAPGSQISAPSPGAVVTGRFTVIGSATLGSQNAAFNFYKLELRAEGDNTWVNVQQASTPVEQGALGSINTALFGSGHFQLKLTVVDETGNYPETCAIRLTFR